MRAEVQQRWRNFKALPEGERFQHVHDQQRDAPRWVKPVVLAVAVVCFGVGIVLSVLPGPAFVFFGLAGGLLAIESAWVARRLDRAEVIARRGLRRFQRWRSRRKRAGA